MVIGNNESFKAAEFLQNLMIYNNYSSFLKLKLLIQLKMVKHINMVIFASNTQKAKSVKDVWNYSDELGSVGELDHLCPRCQEVVKTLV